MARFALAIEYVKDSYVEADLASRARVSKVAGAETSRQRDLRGEVQEDHMQEADAAREIAEVTDYREIFETYGSENERFDWISRNYLIREIVQMIAKGHWKDLKTVAEVVGSYEMEYEKPLAWQALATIWTMVACDELYEDGVNRNQATKLQIREKAECLWARAMCHRKRLPATPENIGGQKSKLQRIRWQRVWEGLGLKDIKNAPAGRPPKNR